MAEAEEFEQLRLVFLLDSHACVFDLEFTVALAVWLIVKCIVDVH